MTGVKPGQVSPFGHPQVITLVCQLPEAYRRLPRPSSAFCAKASTICSFHAFYDLCVLFDCKFATFGHSNHRAFEHGPTHNTMISCLPGFALSEVLWSRMELNHSKFYPAQSPESNHAVESPNIPLFSCLRTRNRAQPYLQYRVFHPE